MYKKQRRLYFSPTDLTRYMESPFASWMDRLSIENHELTPEKDPEDPLMRLLAQRGNTHEDAIEVALVDQGLMLVNVDTGSQEERREQTLLSMQQGIDVIVQARLEIEQFGGFADFLVKIPGASDLGDFHYEVWDTKLSTRVKPTFVIQLCCYAEMLESIQGRRPEFITVALGNNEEARLRTNDYYYYYQSLKSAFLNEQKNFDPNMQPDPSDSNSWGDWSGFAERLLTERDHLFQVANITTGQIKKLNQVGVVSMQQLADSDLEHVAGINSAVLNKLRSQAAIQKKSMGCEKPYFEILPPTADEKSGLQLLPPHSPLDIFFDIEGYPFDEGGLEYLWGCTYFDNEGKRTFKDFWAHNREQEKVAFESFINWAYKRWEQDPSMHIYHYASYEITACRKLMGRYGICEYEVDQLLRNEVFVDLYKIVKGALLLGEPRYSIKNVEHLYRNKRDTGVATGGESVVVYDQWRDLNLSGEQGDTWQTSSILKDIRDYNIDDCDSTQELVEWLRDQQKSHSIDFRGKTEVIEPEISEEITERTLLRDRLLQQARDEIQASPEQATLTENLAWMLEFHRREAKPVFWRLFERLGLSHLELLDDLDCLACCQRSAREPFKPTPKAKNLAFEYSFDPAQEFKGGTDSFYVLGIETANGKNLKVKIILDESDLENGLIALQSSDEPPAIITLIPDEYVPTSPIPEAIEKTVREYESGKLTATKSAIIDYLSRSKPRINGIEGPIASSPDSGKMLKQIIHAVQQLDNSYLAIQGPPGSGKTYTGKHVIAELIKSGAKIGIASNSHKAINNLLLSTAKYCHQEGISARFYCKRDTDPELSEFDVTIVENSEISKYTQPRSVIGTTAWGFAREDMTGQLDYLFVDEAGQVAVANLVAMSRSARNLVLLGDQMQLGQPSQGSHPAESGLSVLDYLLHETPTIPDDMGVFLDTTYRMHSAVNQFISEHVYEGKLGSHPENDRRYILVPDNYAGPLNKEAGIMFIPVPHEGNTQASDEEVAEIVKLANSLIGRLFHTGKDDEPSRTISWADILFVAPYNHQVRKLKDALGKDAKVGSVDKFQGQEAPVVILSMCTSNASQSPRGLDFLFDRNRINVAVSRAQCLAIVVGNPEIGMTSVTTVEQLKLVNLFSAISNP